MKQTPLKRTTPLARGTTELRRTPRKRRPEVTEAMRIRVKARTKRRCLICNRKTRLTLHHVLPVRQWPDLAKVEANLVAVCFPCHMNHEAASRRIRWDELPECAITLAYATSGAAVVYMERTYPRGG